MNARYLACVVNLMASHTDGTVKLIKKNLLEKPITERVLVEGNRNSVWLKEIKKDRRQPAVASQDFG